MKLFDVPGGMATVRLCVEESYLFCNAAILSLDRSSDIDHKHMICFLHGLFPNTKGVCEGISLDIILDFMI